jgi:hypothetical protein
VTTPWPAVVAEAMERFEREAEDQWAKLRAADEPDAEDPTGTEYLQFIREYVAARIGAGVAAVEAAAFTAGMRFQRTGGEQPRGLAPTQGERVAAFIAASAKEERT